MSEFFLLLNPFVKSSIAQNTEIVGGITQRQSQISITRLGLEHSFQKHPDSWNPALKQADRVLVVTRVSKTLAFSFVRTGIVFSDATVVFSLARDRDLALLQSSIHAVFAWQHASRLKNDLRYSPTDALEPFAFPAGFHDAPDGPLDDWEVDSTKDELT
ncbi:hypothetical protein P4238_15825 [Pseudomonas aeruginosa]|nr:hypothetical protein [Pseudomonas aeruginosa]